MYNVIPVSPSRAQRVAAAFAEVLARLSKSAKRRGRGVTSRIERLSPRAWPLLVAVTVSPALLWAGRRLLDDPEDRLGIVAACALCLALWHARSRFTRSPRVALLGIAALLAIAANLPLAGLPPLLRAALGQVAIVVALAAIAARDEPLAPYAGLALLALPLLHGLASQAELPLHDLTVDATAWLLSTGGSEVIRDGATWMIDGRDLVVSSRGGLQLAWVGCFVACVTGWMFRLRDRAFVMRLPAVALAVLAGHVLRTTVLVAADASDVAVTDAMDAAVGLLAFTAVGTTIALVYATGRRATRPAAVAAIPADFARHGALS